MKPIIAITSDLLVGKKTKQPKFVVDSGCCDGVIAAGGIPVMMPCFEREEQVEEFLGQIDGVLMTGGGDLNPQKLGKRPHPSIKAMHPRREASDRVLGKAVIARKIPTLAVGASMQLLNALMGGSIHTHLPEDMPRGLPHRDPLDMTHRHGVFVTPMTRLEEYYGEGEIRVNSNHHQGIRTIAKGLRSCAVAPDGLVEAVETIDRSWWFVGVQWHPENHSASALDSQLFKGFVEAVGTHVEEEVPVLKMAA